MSETPKYTAEPVEAKDLQQANQEDLKKIRDQALADSGLEKRDLTNPKYVTALNRGWAEHYGDSHPLSKKVLEFKQDGDEQKAMDYVKDMQRELGLEPDGVIGYKTIRAYNEYLEKGRTEGTTDKDPFAIEGSIGAIDALGKEEKQEKLKTHSEDLTRRAEGGEEGLTDINGKALQVQEEDGKKVFVGAESGENQGKYYNPESGEYETKEGRTDRIKTQDAEKASKRTERLGELKKIGEEGATYGTDFEGQSIVYSAEKKVWEATGGENAGKTLNLETGKFEITTDQIKKHGEEFATKLRSGTEEELKDLKDVHGNPLKVTEQDDKRVALGTGDNEGKIYQPETGTYKFTTEQIKKHGEEFATKLRSGTEEELKDLKDVHGNPLKVTEQDDKRVALGTGDNEGKIYQPETGTYETTKEEQETTRKQEQARTQREYIASIDEKALDAAADKKIGSWFETKLGDTALADIADLKPKDPRFSDKGFGQESQLSEEQVKALQAIDTRGLPDDMTVRQYTEFVREPLKAAQKFASTGKPEKLPGGLGEDGVKYQKNNTGTILTYREGSEVPKILTPDKGEIDIREDIRNRGTNSFVDLGNGRTVMGFETDGKWTYELQEKQKDGKIATRKIKEDGTLENISEGTLIAARE